MVIVFVLALGISLNTAIFSLVEWIWLRPSPLDQPDSLVRVFALSEGSSSARFSYPDYLDLQEQLASLSGLAALENRGATLNVEPWAKDLHVGVVSRNFFDVLGIQPACGHLFSENDDLYKRNMPGVVISYELWQSVFGGDPNLVGNPIKLKRNAVVLGVASPSFTGLNRDSPRDVWFPVQTWGDVKRRQERNSRSFQLVGRLYPGVTIETAQNEADIAFNRLDLRDRITQKPQSAQFISEVDYQNQRRSPGALFLLGLAMVVLWMACANVASILLAKTWARRDEITLRQALGCSRVRLIRQFLTEGLVLGLLASVIGLVLTKVMVDSCRIFLPVQLSNLHTGIALNPMVTGFCLSLSLVTTLLFGTGPALIATRPNMKTGLRIGQTQTSPSRQTLKGMRILIIGQLGLAFTLTITAALLYRSFQKLYTTDLGFKRKQVLLAEVDPPCTRGEFMPFCRNLLTQINALPRVDAASLSITVPFVSSQHGWTHDVSPSVASDRSNLPVTYNIVTPDYFRTLNIPLLKGRTFTEQDGQSESKVVIINETMARQFWPELNPVGCFIKLGNKPKNQARVIGVVGDGRYYSVMEKVKPYMFVPLGQEICFSLSLMVKTQDSPQALFDSMRLIMKKMSPGMSLFPMTTLAQAYRRAHLGTEICTHIAGTVSLLALLLAAMGLYGTVAFIVSCSTREFGIRIALGAERWDITLMILSRALRLCVFGIPLGLLGAILISKILESALYGINAWDPPAFIISMLVLTGTTLIACYLPTRRATKIDPMQVLRYE